MSDVERFFYKVQEYTGGNLKWNDLGPQEQFVFVNAINIILQITSMR